VPVAATGRTGSKTEAAVDVIMMESGAVRIEKEKKRQVPSRVGGTNNSNVGFDVWCIR
jgi:hypothetical protein